ncbi:ribonuclease H-like protein [Leucogyrophana mollusca]|uniref:Ribonuclease H-like protein n=1 Tax=Leucogyrophana mollusca TaxID=85980 RepID=A0ACB8BXD7_9AGAM|nr:ribonuclease H-like protein [Leucogyrophana mollusca]
MPKKIEQSVKNAPASSNWFALQKKLAPSTKSRRNSPERKRRKVDHTEASSVPGPSSTTVDVEVPASFPRGHHVPVLTTSNEELDFETHESRNGESIATLRKMIFGKLEYTSNHEAPGKYLALDCEMVGIGLDGEESSLARVSLVNYYGAVLLDEFVKQKERVVDYRTQWSGIRATDMIKAKPFGDVQKNVAELLKDRILVGHAVHNDLKVLLLSHPGPMTRDTQQLAAKHKVTKSNRPALRNLVKQELNATIQGGEHSSVTDARATMAVFRLHRKEWEKGNRPPTPGGWASARKRKGREEDEAEGQPAESKTKGRPKEFPGGGKRGISSGLSTIEKRTKGGDKSHLKQLSSADGQWWKNLGGGAKGSLKWSG